MRYHRLLGAILIAMNLHHAKAEDPQKVFKAGAATSNITPWLGLSIAGNMNDVIGKYIHDELHVRCLALDDGESKLVIALCDNCLIPRELFDEAKQLIQEETGLSPERVLIAATHTHSAPAATPAFQSKPDPDYQRFLVRRIADAASLALANLAPARIGWGVGNEPTQVFNRRWKMKPGTIPPNPFGGTADQIQMNPPRASEGLDAPSGPTDPEVSVIAVKTPSGRPIAILANYSLHYVGGVGAEHVSADYFGAFADRITQLLGAEHEDPSFVAILSNGTSGDINNINFREPGKAQQPYEQIHKVANILAGEVYRVLQTIEYHDWVPLASQQTEIALAVRRPSPEEVVHAKEVVVHRKGTTLSMLPEIYAGETVALADYPEKVSLILQAHRIGDLGIAAIPCEVFVRIGLEIKAKSPLHPTFTIELANGYNGYLPTVEQHGLGGYETWRAKSSYLEVEAAPKITEKVLDLLTSLSEVTSR
jgi:hypothetical protein